jgi:flagellar M-ring protein FliF
MAPQPVLVGVGVDGNTVTFTTAAEAALAQANGTITGAAQVAGPDGAPLIQQRPDAEAVEEEPLVKLSRVEGQLRASALAALAEMVDNNPDAAVTVIRRWLTPDETL